MKLKRKLNGTCYLSMPVPQPTSITTAPFRREGFFNKACL